jgi:agmatinase
MAKKFVNFASVPVEDANVVAFGVPLGRGSEEMLESFRDVSDFVDVFDVDMKVNLLDNVKIGDMGNIELRKLEDITEATKKIIGQGKLPLALGKSHLITLYTMHAFPKGTKIIHFDAHGDIKDEYDDEKAAESIEPVEMGRSEMAKYNYTTWLRRASEIIGPENIAMVGIRSCDEVDFGYIEENKMLYFTPMQIRNNLEGTREKLREFVKGSNVYITVDMDTFDPAIAPAVDNPEHNGMFLPEFLALLDEACRGNVVGLDLVEIAPQKDDKITEFLGTWVIYHILYRLMNK